MCSFPIDVDASGYYRIRYSMHDYEELIALLRHNHSTLSATSKVRLIDDAFTLAMTEQIPYSVPLRMSEYLTAETDYMPFVIFSAYFDRMVRWLRGHSRIGDFKKFYTHKMEHLFLRVSNAAFKPDDSTSSLQEFVMTRLCNWGYSPCIRMASELFKILRSRVLPELRPAVYQAGLINGSADDFLFLLSKVDIEPHAVERDRILHGLTGTTNASMIYFLIHDFLHNRSIAEVQKVLQKLVFSPIIDDVVKTVRQNFRKLSSRLRASAPGSERFMWPIMSRLITTEDELLELEEFEDIYPQFIPAPMLAEDRRQARWNIRFRKEHATQIFDYIDGTSHRV
ncbi:peptidase family M1 containing protein [Aphelenchoides avenae]|nr:peptidase family M1 containing protein [Aphelenchus avenae]